MAYRSRLRSSIRRSELSCIVCGCTEDDPCILEGGSLCSWTSPGLCSNPYCLEEIGAEEVED